VIRVPFSTQDEVAAAVDEVASHLARGAIIACPTETVYGLGCALHPAALATLARAKQRDFKPFLLLDNAPPALEGLRWSDAARILAEAFWPGPLTLVLPASPGSYPHEVSGAAGSVAVRSSAHAGVRALVAAVGAPITSTSANVPGEPPTRRVDSP
jgi:L-threonylcarbamoyladenylate synthase